MHGFLDRLYAWARKSRNNMTDIMKDQQEFFYQSKLIMRKIGPTLTQEMRAHGGMDGFILVYYTLGKMRLDIIEGMRAMADDTATFDKEIEYIDNLMKQDPELMKLRNTMNEKLGK